MSRAHTQVGLYLAGFPSMQILLAGVFLAALVLAFYTVALVALERGHLALSVAAYLAGAGVLLAPFAVAFWLR